MHLDAPRLQSAALLSGALAVGLLSGCASLSSRFPSHEDVFIPVPLTIGELRVEGTDSSYVLTGPGYELRSKDRSLLTDAQSAIDRTGASFTRFFATQPPTVRVVLTQVSRRGPRPDSAAAANSGWPRTVNVFVWKPDARNREMMGSGVRDEAVSLPVARAWLTIVTDSAARASTRTRMASNSGADTTARSSAPGWIQSAMTTLLGGAPDPDFLLAALARHPERMVPLRTLLATPKEAFGRSPDERARGVANGPADEMGGQGRGGVFPAPGRGRASMDLTGAMLLNAEATSLASYLAAREGRAFVGQMALALTAGARFEDLIGQGKAIQHDIDAFEREWRSWLATR